MKPIYTLWNKPGETFTGGFLSQYDLAVFATLSALYTKRHYGEAILYTNSQGAKLMEDLKVPFTEIHVVHDNLKDLNPSYWAWSKMKTYRLQEGPFIHIDLDVILWNKIELKTDIVFQNLERLNNHKLYAKGVSMLKNPDESWKEHFIDFAACVGIVGTDRLDWVEE